MDDKTILHHIDELIAEEKQLRGHGEAISDADRTRLQLLEGQLDQAWDLLRQRRARAAAGEDPDTAAERSVNEVEGYRQ